MPFLRNSSGTAASIKKLIRSGFNDRNPDKTRIVGWCDLRNAFWWHCHFRWRLTSLANVRQKRNDWRHLTSFTTIPRPRLSSNRPSSLKFWREKLDKFTNRKKLAEWLFHWPPTRTSVVLSVAHQSFKLEKIIFLCTRLIDFCKIDRRKY